MFHKNTLQSLQYASLEFPKLHHSSPFFSQIPTEKGDLLGAASRPGKLRDYHGPIFWNYGMLPQTWEDGEHGMGSHYPAW